MAEKRCLKMKCPYCNSEKTKVTDKRMAEDLAANRRRRECLSCGKRFTTFERIEATEGITKIRKRDGKIVDFDAEKITKAIFKAAEAVGGKDRAEAERISELVVKEVNKRFANSIPSVEDVQDIVEKMLIEAGHAKTAKAYILYREQHKKIRETKTTFLDVQNTIKGYLHRSDWRVKENSNEAFSFSGLLLYTAGAVMVNYNLNEMYTPAIADAHKNGYVHIHDLSHGVIGYCAGWSLKNLLTLGFGGVPNKVDCKPAKHLNTVIHQMVNYIGCLQMEFAGAQAFSSVDTLLAPFVKTDELSYKEVKQCIQQLVFSLNIPSRWGAQYPFSNLTFDWTVPDDMKEQPAIVGGKEQKFIYGDCQKEMDMINRVFLEVMVEGDANGGLFSFPIPTYNLTKDFNWNSENANLLFELAAKYGTPYFQNYIGSGLDPSSIRAMCLRPEEEIIIKIEEHIRRMSIGELCESYGGKFDKEGWCDNKQKIYAIGINKEMKTVWVPVKRFLKTDGNAITSIETKEGKKIEVSPNHPVPVVTKDGVHIRRANELKGDEYLIMLKNGSNIASKSYKAIEGYEVNERFAKMLGLFISEGNYLYDYRKPYKNIHSAKGIQLTFNLKEIPLIEEAINLLKEIMGKEPKISKDKRFNTISVIVYSKQFVQLLMRNGVNKHGRLPDFIFDSPVSVIKTFLEYHFKGDGYERGQELHINDNLLARDLVLLYSLVGKPVTYTLRKNSQVIRIQHNRGRGALNKVTRGILYDRIPNFLISEKDVKTERRKMFLNQYNTVSLQSLYRFGGLSQQNHKYLMNDVSLIQIRKIEHELFDKPQLFYDIELEGEHLFVHSLGNVTHNCCRLNLNQRELMSRPGGMWGPGDSTGSIGVMTLNMNRIGYEAKKDEARFFELLDRYLNLSRDALEIKREVIEKNMQNGLMPFTKRYLGTFNNHFSTIGLCGMHECCLNFLGRGIETLEGKDFTVKVLMFMREKLKQFQQETGNLYNLEATPAESTAYRLARLDKKMYPDIITAGEKEPYLTNSTHLPVNLTDDAITAIEHQNEIQPLYTGGTIFHTFLGERVSSGESCKRLVKKIAYNTKLPYFTITPTFSICKSHGYIHGEKFNCPECGAETEVYSRIVGYYRPVQNWNAGKVEEFKDRLEYVEEKSLRHEFKSKIERALEKPLEIMA